jgi:steroid delta-isomerase
MTRADGIEVVATCYRLIDAGDVDGMLKLFADDAVYQRPGYPPLAGSAALRVFYTSTRMIRQGVHILHTLVVSGDVVAVEGTFRGTLKDGSAVEQRFADFFRLCGHRVSERRTYFDAPAV